MELLTIIILMIGGIFSGLFGANVGGATFVMFPLLLLVGLPTHVAIATNRLSGLFLDSTGTVRFYQKKKLNLRMGLYLGIIAGIGSMIGAMIVIGTNEKYLNLIIAIIFVILFVVIIIKDKIGIKERRITHKNLLLISFFTFILGIYGGFFGAGFATVLMFLLVLLGYSFIRSAAITRITGVFMCGISSIVFALNGLIQYDYAIVLGIGCAIGAWIGAGIGVKRGNEFIKGLFITVVLVTVVKLVLDFFGVGFW